MQEAFTGANFSTDNILSYDDGLRLHVPAGVQEALATSALGLRGAGLFQLIAQYAYFCQTGDSYFPDENGEDAVIDVFDSRTQRLLRPVPRRPSYLAAMRREEDPGSINFLLQDF